MSFVKRTAKGSLRFVVIGLLFTMVSTIILASNWESVSTFAAGFANANAKPETTSLKKDSALVKEFFKNDDFLTPGTCDTAGPIEVEGSIVGTTPTAYATLGAAFAAINAGTHTGAITIDVCGDTTEGATSATLNASGTGTASYTGITISPAGGAARTISGATTAGSPMIDFSGADNVTIDGLNTGGNSLTIANTTVSAITGTSTIRFIGDATNNTITNSNIQGSANASVATNGANIFFSTGTTTGNDNNTISNNNIGPAGANLPTKGILGNGSTTTTAIGNSGNIINNNNIFDFFGAAVTSAGIATNGGCNTWSITNNRFYQTGTRTWTTGALHNAINIGNTTATSGAQGFTITGNIVGFASNTQTGTYTLTGTTGTFRGIIFNGITGGTVSNINNNTVASVSVTGVTSSGTSSGAPFMGIYVTNGLANTNNNTIGSQTATGSLTFSTNSASAADVIAIFNFSVDAWTANNNLIGGITAANAGAGAANAYGLRLNTSSTVNTTLTGNTVGGTVANSIQSTSTTTGAQVAGIFVSTSIATLTSNTIRNLTNAGGTGTSTAASVAGIVFVSATPINTASQNTIFNLSNTNATAASVVTGIQFTGGTGNVVERNNIYGLTAATNSASAEINGIRVAGGTTVYRNNIIAIGAGIANALGGAASNGGSLGINGINESLGTNQFFHNSVYIGGGPTAGTGASFAFNGNQTVNTRSFRDNIFFNARSNGGATGKNYAVKINGTAANPSGLTINNNVYFANGTGGVFGFFNSLDVANLAAWKTAVGQDVGSFESNPQYNDPTNAVPDLHLHPTNATVAEGNGADVGVTLDFDGQTRSGLTPVDIGADAGNFSGVDLSAPVIAYSPFLNTSSTTNRVVSVSISDVTGVATGGNAPRIYYRKNAGAYFSQACSLSSGTVQNGVWSCTINNADVGGVVATDGISYFVVAQDTLGNLASNPSGGFSGTNVNTVTTPPTTPNQYTIVAAISGAFNVGTGETYTSLTNTGGIFEAINAAEVTGNVVINLTTDLTGELGTVALNEFASPFTILIKPSGAPRTITGSNTGALIRLNGADRVRIDGSTASSFAENIVGGNPAIRELTIQNTNVGTSAVVMSVGSNATNGAQNNTIQNINILGQDPTTTLIGISLGGVTPGTAATGPNTGNRVENCSIKRAIFGIYSAGLSAASPNTGTVITMNETSDVTTDRIRRVGIVVFNENGVQITENSLNGISTNESADAMGIGLGNQSIDNTITTTGGVINALVSKNNINGVASLSATGFSAAGITVAGNTGGANTIVNNMITGVTAPATSPDIPAGIFVVGATGSITRLYHNSIAMTGDRGTVASQMPSFGVAITGTDPTVELKNNIFYTTQIASGGGVNAKSYAIGMVTTTFANLDSNYNLFYSSGANAGFYRSGSLTTAAGTDYATLASWSAAVSDDVNSIGETDPTFVNPLTDLHIQAGSPAINTGTVLAAVTSDFDGDIRPSGISSDIGADELVIAAPGTVQFSAATYSVGEGGGTVTLTVTRTGGSNGAVTANYALAGGTATGGATCGTGVDYVNTGGSVMFANGDAADKTFMVSVCDDSLYENPDETFNATLSIGSGGATLGTPNPAAVTITENDTSPSLQFSSATGSVGEGGGSATLTVTRTGATENAVSVDFATASGTATGGASCGAGIDYVSTNGTLNFASGATSNSFSVSICDDSLIEGNENFMATLSNSTGGATVGTPATETVTINDNDVDTTPPTVSYTPLSNIFSVSDRTFNVTATDNVGVTAVTVVWANNGGASGSLTNPCTFVSGTTWSCTILSGFGAPPQTSPGTVSYFVSADDAASNSTTNPTGGTLAGGTRNLFTIGFNGTIDVSVINTFDNLNTGTGFTLNGNATVNNVLTLGFGQFYTGANTLTLGCTATVASAGTNNYIVGNVQKMYCGTGSFIYPVGTTPDGTLQDGLTPEGFLSEYTPFVANVTAGTFPSSLTVSVTDGFMAGAQTSQSVSRFWNVTETGDLTADISFTYLNQDINGAETSYNVLRREAFTATYSGGTVNAATNTATAPGVSNFSSWTAGLMVPVAANASLSGQVLSANGQGIRNATVVISGGGLTAPRYVTTGTFGNYQFDDLRVGESYVVTVVSKRFTFPTPTIVVNLLDNAADINFMAEDR